MIWIDYAITVLVSMRLLIGLLRGFSLEMLSLLFWALGTCIGLGFSVEFSVFLESAMTNFIPKIAASFISLLFITLIIGGLIRLILGESIKKYDLTFIDHLGGMIIGVLNGIFIVGVLVILAGLTHLPDDFWWKESKLLPPFQMGAIWLRDHIPSGMTEYVHYR